jgi:hypothetical protein
MVMDTKVTLSFDAAVIEKAKKFAEKNNMSLSRLTEFLLRQITNNQYKTLEEFPISDWVNQVAEGEAEYLTKPRGRKAIKSEYYQSRS